MSNQNVCFLSCFSLHEYLNVLFSLKDIYWAFWESDDVFPGHTRTSVFRQSFAVSVSTTPLLDCNMRNLKEINSLNLPLTVRGDAFLCTYCNVHIYERGEGVLPR